MNNEELSFDIIQHFIKEKGLINHQIEGYNDFIHNGIRKTFAEENKIVLRENDKKFVYKFEHPLMESPKLVDDNRIIREYTPMEARFRDISYHGALRVDLVSEEYSSDDKLLSSTTQHRLILAHIPVMIGSDICNLKRMSKIEIKSSGECINDDGGYFIVKGKERVIIAQERANYNTINVYKNTDNSYYSEVRSMSEETGHSALTQCVLPVNQRGMYFNLPCISQKINVGVIFMALGLDENNIKDVLRPKNIYDILSEKEKRRWDKLITYIIRDSWFVREQGEESVDKAIEYISTFVNTVSETPIEYTKQVLSHELFPHMSISCDDEEYIWFLSRMVVKMFMTYIGKRPQDDKDHYTNKRVEGVGTLMTDLFRTSFKRFIRNVLYHMQKQQNISYIISKVNNITKDIKYCFSTGNWGLQKTAYVRTGVSQVLARLSYTSTISHLRRVIVPVGKEVKNSEIRQIHQSSTFFLCPAETPEGAPVGIVKNFALTTTISNKVSGYIIKNILDHDDIIGITDDKTCTPIFLNGRVYGFTNDYIKTLQHIRELRTHLIIPQSVSISYSRYSDEIRIFSDEGRMMRPLIYLGEDFKNFDFNNKYTFDELIHRDIIRYLDPTEIENEVIAMTHDDIQEGIHTYMEIHPVCMLGVVGVTIPYPDHNQAPRVCYYSSMNKQTIGYYASNNNMRTDTTVHQLDYFQKPLVTTRVGDMIKNSDMPAGMNCIVAIMPESQNQEDCIIINKASIDRGLFVSHTFRTVTIDEKKSDSNTSSKICVPPIEYRKPNYNYHKLDKNGIVRKGMFVNVGDVLVGKILKKISKEGEEISDVSVVVNMKEEGIIDSIFHTKNNEGYRIIKIKVRTIKTPELGDKVASRAAQKGTVGAIYNQEDMPFNKDGIVPDIILNPAAMPSRMTISQLLECVLGKVCAINGEIGDATPFSSSSTGVAESICQRLEATGYDGTGYETLMNGKTGERYKSQIFIGPTFYHKLKHMVSDKMYARGFGNCQMLTRQPVNGRSRYGALRVGEMERDAMIGQGCANVLLDRLYEASDPYGMYICNECGQVPHATDYCDVCQSSDIRMVKIPYATKLLQQQLGGLCIKTSLIPEEY